MRITTSRTSPVLFAPHRENLFRASASHSKSESHSSDPIIERLGFWQRHKAKRTYHLPWSFRIDSKTGNYSEDWAELFPWQHRADIRSLINSHNQLTSIWGAVFMIAQMGLMLGTVMDAPGEVVVVNDMDQLRAQSPGYISSAIIYSFHSSPAEFDPILQALDNTGALLRDLMSGKKIKKSVLVQTNQQSRAALELWHRIDARKSNGT